MGKMTVNRRLLPLKVHYFLYFTAIAFVLPFRTVLAKQLGISATATGFIFLAVPFLKTVTNPLIGYVIDSLKKFRLILGLCLICVGLSNLALLYIPPLGKPPPDLKNISFGFDHDCSVPNNHFNNSFNRCDMPDSGHRDLHLLCKLRCQPSPIDDTYRGRSRMKNCGRPFYLESEVEVRTQNCEYTLSISDGRVFFYSKHANYFTEYTLLEGQNTYVKSPGASISSEIQESSSNASVNAESPSGLPESFPGTAAAHLLCPCQKKISCIARDCEEHSGNDPVQNEYLSAQLWSLFFLTALASMGVTAVIFLVDTVCYEILRQDKDKYGYQRMWGTIGWGLGCLVSGYINMITTSGDEIDYTMSFYLQLLIIVVDLIAVWKIEVTEVPYSPRIFKDVGRLLKHRDVCLNLLVVFVIGVLSGIIWNYQFWFMEQIGSSQLVMGLSQIVECVAAELPCFLVSGWVIRKIGYNHCYDLTFLCFGLRYLCYTFMRDPWMTLPAGLLHGPTFGIFYAAMTMYGKTKAPPGTEATVQSLLSVAFDCVGIGVGCVLGGIGFDVIGSRSTFFCAAVVSFVGLGVRLLSQLIPFLCQRRRSKEKSVDTPLEERSFPAEKIQRLASVLKV